MRWVDEGYVLGARRFGETGAVAHLLTREHGRHAGLLRGAFSKRQRGLTEPGNRVTATWQARLDDNLGTYILEMAEANSAELLSAPRRLMGLSAACAVVDGAVPEREPHPALFDGFAALVGALLADTDDAVWPGLYVRFEIGLLQELGFGLGLETCAVTGTADDLIYVSPRTGRAVSAAGGEPYKDKLLALPGFLRGGDATEADFAAGLRLSGHFLARHSFGAVNRPLPAVRQRLADMFEANG